MEYFRCTLEGCPPGLPKGAAPACPRVPRIPAPCRGCKLRKNKDAREYGVYKVDGLDFTDDDMKLVWKFLRHSLQMTTGAILWPDNAGSTPPYNHDNFKAECLERLPSKESYSNQAAVIEEVGSTVPEEAPATISEQFL